MSDAFATAFFQVAAWMGKVTSLKSSFTALASLYDISIESTNNSSSVIVSLRFILR